MGVLKNDWEGIREEAIVAKLKKCFCVYLEARKNATNLHAGIVV